jgi:protein-L-isoaspartate(D-aspartate) O-methyltransferase
VEDSYRHKGMRKQLVKKLEAKGIKSERVLKAIEKVPRHYFFEAAFEEHAYQDKAFPIGEGQTISQPYTVAFQTELLEITTGSKVLEIGTGSGYQCCVLLEMGAKVWTIERHQKLYEQARYMLGKMGYKAFFFCGDGSIGLPSHAPFDRIIVTAGAPWVPEQLIAQLNPGGILVIPVGNDEKQTMIRIIKTRDNRIIEEEHGLFKFVPLKGKAGWHV